MTTAEMVGRVFDAVADETKNFIKSSTATGGSTTTVVDASLAAGDDFFNEMELEITSGDALGERREVTDYVSSTNTITVDSAFSVAIASGVTYVVGHKGFMSFKEVLQFLTDGVQALKTNFADPVFFRNVATTTLDGYSIAGKDYGETTVPSDIIRPIAIYLSGNKLRIVPPDRARQFYDDPYFENGILLYGTDVQNSARPAHFKPELNAQLRWVYIKESDVTVATPSDLPSNLHQPVVDFAISRAFEKLQKPDLAGLALSRFKNAIEANNAQAIQAVG